MELKIITNNAEDTKNLAATLAKSIASGTVVSLVGDLGAGKTTFTKGFALGLGITEPVTSPTFTIMNEYTTGNIPLYHFDFYRIENEEEVAELGFAELFANLNGIAICEWAEKTPKLLPKNYLEITFEKVDDDKRTITVKQVNK